MLNISISKGQGCEMQLRMIFMKIHVVRSYVFRVCYCFVKYLPPSYFRPFPFGPALRCLFAKGFLDSIGRNVNIESGAHFSLGGAGIRIGTNSGVGIRAQISPFVTIGDDVMMGPDVLILTRNHKFSHLNMPMRKQGYDDYRPVVIEDDVWIGARAIILPGVRIGRGSIIAAAAVVTKSVEAYSIVAGNPGRVVKRRCTPIE